MSSYYLFKKCLKFKAKLEEAFDTTSGHDHDGTNSKAITFGELSLADGKILVGNGSGLAVAVTPSGDVTISNAGVTALGAKKVLASMVALADGKILVGGADGASAAQTVSGDITISNAGVSAIGAGKVTLAQVAATAKTHFLSYPIEDLAANGDIAARAIFAVPAGMTATLVKASIIMNGAAAGVDDSNTCVIALTDGTNTIVTKTYNTGTPMPAENAEGDLGTLEVAYKTLAAAGKLYFTVTNGTSADTPKMILQVAYTLADA